MLHWKKNKGYLLIYLLEVLTTEFLMISRPTKSDKGSFSNGQKLYGKIISSFC